jgi:two-component system response regulator AtoC
LRERKQDIPFLTKFFLKDLSERFGREIRPLSDNMLKMMSEYDWPGNIRELQNWVARYIVLGFEDALLQELERRKKEPAEVVPISPIAEGQVEKLNASGEDLDLKRSSKRAAQERERELIERTLEANHWNRRRTAEQLHISYRALLYKMHDAGFLSSRTTSKAEAIEHNEKNNHEKKRPGNDCPDAGS